MKRQMEKRDYCFFWVVTLKENLDQWDFSLQSTYVHQSFTIQLPRSLRFSYSIKHLHHLGIATQTYCGYFVAQSSRLYLGLCLQRFVSDARQNNTCPDTCRKSFFVVELFLLLGTYRKHKGSKFDTTLAIIFYISRIRRPIHAEGYSGQLSEALPFPKYTEMPGHIINLILN